MKFITARVQGMISPAQHDKELELTLPVSSITLCKMDEDVPDRFRLNHQDPQVGLVVYKMGAMGFDIAKDKLEAL